MPAKADLHIHTQCSDGNFTPAQAVEQAKKKNLCCISITDHDTRKGYFEALDRANELEIELLPGAEITAQMGDKEVHILAYCFEPEADIIEEFLQQQKSARKQRIKGIIDTVQKTGVEVSYDEVWAEANGANIGRPHLARVLTQKGYVGTPKEAFIRYLSDKKLGDIKNDYPDYKEVIDIIKKAGGASVVAHPGKMITTKQMQAFLEAGIDGVECIHPSHTYKLQKKYTEFCEARGLLMTGGSDTHRGINAGYTHMGVVTIAYKYVESLKRMTAQRKKLIETN